jgi:threonine synthase
LAAEPDRGLDRNRLGVKPASLWRCAAFLPAAEKNAVSPGEGNTPLRPAPGHGLCEVWITVAVTMPIGATQGTVWALEVLRRTHARAVRIDDDMLVRWIARPAHCEGQWAKPAAVAPLAGIERLRRQGTICGGDRVVALIVASGPKDTSPTPTSLPAPPTATDGLDALLRTLHQTYGFGRDD